MEWISENKVKNGNYPRLVREAEPYGGGKGKRD